MSAADHLERRLFYSARELAGFLANDSEPKVQEAGTSFVDDSDLFNRRVLEAKDPSYVPYGSSYLNSDTPTLYEHIEKHGVQKPVLLHDKYIEKDQTPTIMSGHHRVAVAYSVNPEMFVPVEYIR